MARPTNAQIQEEIGETEGAINSGASEFPGMSYEEGVNNALRWALGETDDRPMENE